jgi:Amylo-alpha-1,6-glucosidase/Central domain of human glycogen debranching enzyme
MLDIARSIRPQLYVNAELFTGSLDRDVEYVGRLGINSLVREAMQSSGAADLVGKLWNYGGTPLASLRPLPRASSATVRLLAAQKLQNNGIRGNAHKIPKTSSSSTPLKPVESGVLLESDGHEDLELDQNEDLENIPHIMDAPLPSLVPALRRILSANFSPMSERPRSNNPDDLPLLKSDNNETDDLKVNNMDVIKSNKKPNNQQLYRERDAAAIFGSVGGFAVEASPAKMIPIPVPVDSSDCGCGPDHNVLSDSLSAFAQALLGANEASTLLLLPSPLPTLLFDCTHDNEPPAVTRHPVDAVATAALVAAAVCATGSTRGFDDATPSNLSVVTEFRLYDVAAAHEQVWTCTSTNTTNIPLKLSPVIPPTYASALWIPKPLKNDSLGYSWSPAQIVAPFQTGFRLLRRRINVLKQEMAARGHSEIYIGHTPVVSAPSTDIVTVVRGHPVLPTSYVIIARTAGTRYAGESASRGDSTPLPIIKIEGRVTGVVLAASVRIPAAPIAAPPPRGKRLDSASVLMSEFNTSESSALASCGVEWLPVRAEDASPTADMGYGSPNYAPPASSLHMTETPRPLYAPFTPDPFFINGLPVMLKYRDDTMPAPFDSEAWASFVAGRAREGTQEAAAAAYAASSAGSSWSDLVLGLATVEESDKDGHVIVRNAALMCANSASSDRKETNNQSSRGLSLTFGEVASASLDSRFTSSSNIPTASDNNDIDFSSIVYSRVTLDSKLFTPGSVLILKVRSPRNVSVSVPSAATPKATEDNHAPLIDSSAMNSLSARSRKSMHGSFVDLLLRGDEQVALTTMANDASFESEYGEIVTESSDLGLPISDSMTQGSSGKPSSNRSLVLIAEDSAKNTPLTIRRRSIQRLSGSVPKNRSTTPLVDALLPPSYPANVQQNTALTTPVPRGRRSSSKDDTLSIDSSKKRQPTTQLSFFKGLGAILLGPPVSELYSSFVLNPTVTLTSLNKLLFRCEAEERDDTNGNRGCYVVPGVGRLAWAGLAGLVPHLRHCRRWNDLGHALCENIRAGDWLQDYILSRLQEDNALEGVANWLAAHFILVRRLPPGLKPQAFDRVFSAVYTAAIRAAIRRMRHGLVVAAALRRGSYVHHNQGKDLENIFVEADENENDEEPSSIGPLTFVLAMTSVQLIGETKSAPLLYAPLLENHEDEDENEYPTTSMSSMSSINSTKLVNAPVSLAAGVEHFATGFMRVWGRDTFISLRGLMLATGRFAEARRTILSFASTIRHGLIPNLMDSGKSPRFNCRDAAWWFLQAIRDYTELAPEGLGILNALVRRRFPSDKMDDYEFGIQGPVFRKTMPPPILLSDLIHEIIARHAACIRFVEWKAGKSLDEHMTEGMLSIFFLLKRETLCSGHFFLYFLNVGGFLVEVHVDENTGFIHGGNVHNCVCI